MEVTRQINFTEALKARAFEKYLKKAAELDARIEVLNAKKAELQAAEENEWP
ncbi:hypothetical protein [Arthrobacter sp. KBS0703]|uniref:hypothetical protein n=1 Tax=Arthrobacter sp. KBS0703 TaxID=1955698 RepID=UPI00163D3FB6|nr:hypothetical protein [Arthrobacter sp. KBS0703]